jgi:AcrR family transcriptional regulator
MGPGSTVETRAYGDLRTRLVATAWKMFETRGYERTTVEGIIRTLGVSKGAFYHHFGSKRDLLDAVVESMMQAAFEQVGPVLRHGSLGALEKINLFMASSRVWRMRNLDAVLEIARVIYRDENAIVRQKMNARGVQMVLPDLERVIVQGVEEGVIRTEDPAELARFYLHVSNVIGEIQMRSLIEDGDTAEGRERVERRIGFFIEMLERILGAEPGSIERVDEGYIERVLGSLGGRDA